MNWDAIAAVGQMLGSIAVLVTLGYLAVQVRYTRTEVARSVVENRGQSARENATLIVSDEHLRRAWQKAHDALGLDAGPGVKVLMERAGLDALEARQVASYCFLTWQGAAMSIDHYNELSDAERSWSDQRFRMSWGTFGINRLWYEAAKAGLRPESVAHVDRLLAQSA